MLGRLLVHPNGIGCTAVNCCVFADRFVVANVGDSRAVLCRRGRAVDLSTDHKPNDPKELARIVGAGGWLEPEGSGDLMMHRINGDLNLSRALGDLEYKQDASRSPEAQIISAEPDVFEMERHVDDEFLVIACDGIWDVVTSQQGIDFVRQRLGDRSTWHRFVGETPSRLSLICSELLDFCLSPDLEETDGLGGDNMTAIIVLLMPSPSGEELVSARRLPAPVSPPLPAPIGSQPSARMVPQFLPVGSPGVVRQQFPQAFRSQGSFPKPLPQPSQVYGSLATCGLAQVTVVAPLRGAWQPTPHQHG